MRLTSVMKACENVKPDKELMKLYYLYLLLADAIVLVTTVLPSVVAALLFLPLNEALTVTIVLVIPFLFIVFFVAYWIPRFYASITYRFGSTEFTVERGVWWRHSSTVPYNRITNIDVVQGPLSRRFGLAKIRVQTAGYSATGAAAVAEAQIIGVKNYEEIKEFIMEQVRRTKPIAVEAAAEGEAEKPSSTNVPQQILDELKTIRKLLEKKEAK